jgi:8-oxo-dGTP diphosphatase
VLHVVAAALTDAHGRILIAQRPPGSHLAGGWEFPGGKLEPGEACLAGLARELHEELGITLGRGPHRPLLKVEHAYGARQLRIHLWVVTDFSGEPRGLDGQALRWCTLDELEHADLLPADAPMVRALRLPARLTLPDNPLYAIAAAESAFKGDPQQLRGVACAAAAAARAARKADFIVLTVSLPDAELAELCAAVSVPVYARGLELPAAWALGASGVSDLPAP